MPEMLPADDLIQPRDPNAVPADATETVPADATASPGLSDEILKLPVFQGLFAGSPSAVSAPIKEFSKRPEGKLIKEFAPELMKAGIAFYRSTEGDLGVIFNQAYIHPDEIMEADKSGKLQEVAPSFDSVSKAIASSGEKNPVLSHQGVPESFKTSSMMGMPQGSSGGAGVAPMPAGAQTKTQVARLQSMTPGGPLTGAKPGAGRLINSILKPVK